MLFKHHNGAGCITCHSLDITKNGFGPNLSGIGLRATVKHLVQSIVEPNAVITEGFNMQMILIDEGKTFSGVLLEESGLSVTLGQSTGDTLAFPNTGKPMFRISIPETWEPEHDDDNVLSATSPEENVSLTAWELTSVQDAENVE